MLILKKKIKKMIMTLKSRGLLSGKQLHAWSYYYKLLADGNCDFKRDLLLESHSHLNNIEEIIKRKIREKQKRKREEQDDITNIVKKMKKCSLKRKISMDNTQTKKQKFN